MSDAGNLGPNTKFIGVKGARALLNTPALLLDLDALELNIAAMANFTKTNGINLRPHSKGGKSIAIARMQIEAGAVGICCTTIGEAEVVAGSGIKNVLITSPVVTPTMSERLMSLNGLVEGLMVVVDNAANVEQLNASSGKAGKPLSVIVEYDVGQNRTGVRREEDVVALAHKIIGSSHLRFCGVQAYYGHFQHIATFAERKAAALAQTQRVKALVDRLLADGLEPRIVTGGGTGTFEIDAEARIYTEVQPGSYPFMDREYVEIESGRNGNSLFTPSLFVMASVVSTNRENFAIVNAGYKSFATEGGMPVIARPHLVDAAYQLMGDEHGGITYSAGGSGLKLGEAVEFLTPHCDPTINLYDRYHCVRGDTLVDIWPVDARGR